MYPCNLIYLVYQTLKLKHFAGVNRVRHMQPYRGEEVDVGIFLPCTRCLLLRINSHPKNEEVGLQRMAARKRVKMCGELEGEQLTD